MRLRFKRQFPVSWNRGADGADFYILDFYCHELKLGIELDGDIHKFQKEYDKYRDNILKEMGISVLRFDNSELNDLSTFIQKLSVTIEEMKCK